VDYNKNGKRMQAREFREGVNSILRVDSSEQLGYNAERFLHAAAQNVPAEVRRITLASGVSI
jgi:hypothetical protein